MPQSRKIWYESNGQFLRRARPNLCVRTNFLHLSWSGGPPLRLGRSTVLLRRIFLTANTLIRYSDNIMGCKVMPRESGLSPRLVFISNPASTILTARYWRQLVPGNWYSTVCCSFLQPAFYAKKQWLHCVSYSLDRMASVREYCNWWPPKRNLESVTLPKGHYRS